MLIDDLLGRGTIGNTAADSGEVLGGDTEAIGIKDTSRSVRQFS